MKNNHGWIVIILLIIAALQLAACGGSSVAGAESEKPAHLEDISGSEFKRVVLTEKAAERLDIQTVPVASGAEVASSDAAAFTPPDDSLVVPYAAVIYGLHGETWVYTRPEPLTYERQPITIDRIEGGLVILSAGPEPGTEVVTVGVIELYGEETGIKK